MPLRILALLGALLALNACERSEEVLVQEGASPLPSPAALAIDRNAIASVKVQHPVEAVWGPAKNQPRIELIGFDLERDTLSAAAPLEVTWTWKIHERLTDNYKIMVHLELPDGRFLNFDHQPNDGPLSKLPKNHVFKHTHTLTVPAGTQPGTGLLRVGIFEDKAPDWRRLPLIALTQSALPAKHQAVDVARIAIQPFKDSLIAYRAETPPVLDGHLNDPAWAQAQATEPLRHPVSGNFAGKTTLKVVYTSTDLWVAFEVPDQDIRSAFTERDATIWEQDCVEIYLNPDNDDGSYWELQIGAADTRIENIPPIFDAYFDNPRRPDWHIAKNQNLQGMEVAVTRKGTLNSKELDRDNSYIIEARIPFAGITAYRDVARPIQAKFPPASGDRWGFNAYHVDYDMREGGRTFTQHAAWALVGGDFHNLAGFGELVFE